MRHTALLVAALVVVGAGAPAVVASPAAAPADGPGDAGVAQVADGDDGNETGDDSPAPGARLAAVVNVQGAEVEGEVAERSFGRQLAAARSNASKASVLAAQTGDLSERIRQLEDRKRALQDARDDDNISVGRYRAEMARVAAELSTANRLLNRTSSEATELPAAALQNAGVDATDLQRLRRAAGNLSGPEIAEIARDLGGPPVNRSVGPPGGVTVGPPGNATAGPPAGTSNPGPPGNDTRGSPTDRTQGPPKNATRGPPADPGPPSGTGGAAATTGLLGSPLGVVTP